MKRVYFIVFVTLAFVLTMYGAFKLGINKVPKVNITSSRKILVNLTTKKPVLYNTSLQQTCQQICHLVPELPFGMERHLIQIGDIPVVPDEDREKTPIDYIVSPMLNGGIWAYRKRGDTTGEQCANSLNAGVAIVIVCNDRWHQLNVTLYYLLPLLQKQRLCFRIFVVEQRTPKNLNKAMLMNVGFVEATNRFQFRCVVFQDADLAPINDVNPYGCDSLTDGVVVHLGVALDNRQYRLNYDTLVGGALKFSRTNFLQVNGYSNMYYGWGQEDDDMEVRIRKSGLSYMHMVSRIARYHAVPHEPRPKNEVPKHRDLLKMAETRIKQDGLSSLSYKLVAVSEKPYYTHLLIDLPEEV